MLPSLLPGIELSRSIEVDAGRCITFMGPEAMVYATPWMVSDAEYVCHDAVVPHLQQGESTVGIELQIDHLAATPLGMNVHVQVQVVKVDRRRVGFAFAVHDDIELVGRGTHTRFVVDTETTIERLRKKGELHASSESVPKSGRQDY